MPEVLLLYFKGCPNVEKARENIKTALERASLPLNWKEIDMEDEAAPQSLRGFPSPTVLVDGVCVRTGRSVPPAKAGSCSVDGAPEVEGILKGLERAHEKDN